MTHIEVCVGIKIKIRFSYLFNFIMYSNLLPYYITTDLIIQYTF